MRKGFVMVAILLLSFWLGARGLDADAVWYDEIGSYRCAGGDPLPPRTLAEIWTCNRANPPGFFMIYAVWGRLTDWTPFAGRALALFAGMIAVAAVYHVGESFAGGRVGLTAALIMGTSAFFVEYLHELRAYTLYVLITVWITGTYARLIWRRRIRPRIQAAFVIGLAASAYIHYFAVPVALATGLYHFAFARKSRRWVRVTLLMILAALLCLPLVWLLVRALGVNVGSAGRAELAMNSAEMLRLLAYALSNGTYLLLPVILYGIVAATSYRRFGALIAFLGGTLVLIFLAANALSPFMAHVRYMIGLLPLAALLSAMGIDRLYSTHRATAWIVIGVWVVTGITASFTPTFSDTLFREEHLALSPRHLPLHLLARQVEDEPDGAVILYRPEQARFLKEMFTFYFEPLPLRAVLLYDVPRTQLNALLDDVDRVWLARAQDAGEARPADLSGLYAALSGQFAPPERVLSHPELVVELYRRISPARPPVPPAESPVAHFGDVITLASHTAVPESAEGRLTVTLDWESPGVYRDAYSVALHLQSADGELAAQIDEGFPPAAYAYQALTLPLEAVPPGHYDLWLVVYTWVDGVPVSVQDMRTGESGSRLFMGTVTVQR